MIRSILCVAGIVVSAGAHAASASNTRTWISGKGADTATCGPIASPCRTLQVAHDNTVAGGEVNVLDPAGYGAVTITKSITIFNDGVGVAGVLAAAGGNAITINAAANDEITLRGLAVEGAKVGANGIVFNSGGKLTVDKCVVQGFVGSNTTHGNGILIRHTAGSPTFTITETTASNNSNVGIYFIPGGAGAGFVMIDRATTVNNQSGIVAASVVTTATESRVLVTNSLSAHNSSAGFQLVGSLTGVLFISFDGVTAFHNNIGIDIGPSGSSSGYAEMSRSRLTDNVAYDLKSTISQFYTYKNNYLIGKSVSYVGTAAPF